MDIRKDIDDMLNNLKGNEEPAVPHRKTIPAVHTQKAPADSMSVDELLDSLVHENENRVTEPAKDTQSKTPEPEKPRKKRIVISGELPDYEAIRAASLEKDRLEAERKAAEEAERQRIEAERKAAEEAERQRIEEENAVDETESSPFSFEEEINVVSSSSGEGELSVDELMEAAIAAVKGETDPVGDMIDNIRDDAEKAIADLDNDKSEEEVTADDADNADDEPAEEKEAESTTPKGRITSTLEKIMAEDPDEIIEERSEKAESDELAEPPSGNFKKRLYAVLGVIFAVLACIGLVTVISKSIGFFGNFTSGNSKKDGFADVIYPTVIMDIESFDDPSQLTSDQVITAAIWSMIMSDGTMDQYEKTFDVVKVPAVDVESYAVKLFGDNLPELTHTTVGPAESRFYYNDETKSYNVPVTPVTFTYSPEIKSVTKNGNDYTLVVDYIDELPEWLPKTSSKSVQYTLVDTNEGYTIKAMKVLSESNNI